MSRFLSDVQELVLLVRKTRPGATEQQIAALTGLTLEEVERILEELKQMGLAR
ncbi:MAG TPA: hypothetical protein VFD92_20180 [Candidatus Binatia bacterium]|nr:hypothetical protein [Candidatus Binatia bacterium]